MRIPFISRPRDRQPSPDERLAIKGWHVAGTPTGQRYTLTVSRGDTSISVKAPTREQAIEIVERAIG